MATSTSDTTGSPATVTRRIAIDDLEDERDYVLAKLYDHRDDVDDIEDELLDREDEFLDREDEVFELEDRLEQIRHELRAHAGWN
ncbi:uncharacterized protein LTR77_006891 [Saxophila tyrrhenica]|uniref:HalX domain-containing protein n=1 Tax=Saxophila tyrrhenica TaxID=1690608 RepID=A0AAV9P632_9PEZI|nr:hypothetical protein LTR77_006891 [Saxophila tyrrhenica]